MLAVSKLVGALLSPLTLVMLLMIAGLCALLRGQLHTGRRIIAVSLAALFAVCYAPLGFWLLVPLEERFPRDAKAILAPDLAGIVLLGGAVQTSLTRVHGSLHLGNANERILETWDLSRQRPDLPLFLVGGNVYGGTPTEAEAMATWLAAQGVDRRRIHIEAASRSTHENARNARPVIADLIGSDKQLLLVTSAFHMPRAIASFRANGLNVRAWPVDFRTRGAADLWRVTSNPLEGHDRTHVGMREWIGLFAYWVLGRTNTLWPAP